ncbi:MAG: hypothetical protein IPM02_24620 [Betaproteobacteria bacterium]|nr:hypothetical protein [Betaproteobacteria bacterium]
MPPIGALGERVQASGGGWLMDDWQDDQAILDQLSRLLSAAETGNLARAAENASRATLCGSGSMGRLTADVYAGVKAPVKDAPAISDKERVYAALAAAQGGGPGGPGRATHRACVADPSRARGGQISLHPARALVRAGASAKLAAPPQGATSGVDVGVMSQVLVADLRRLAQSLAGDAGQARADVTAEFWRVGRELRAALPPLLLPGRLLA